MTSPPDARANGRRVVAIIASLAVLVSAVVAGFLLRDRGRATPSAGAPGPSSTSPAVPSASGVSTPATGAPSTAAGASGGGAGSPDCASDAEGPLRENTQFTAADGAGTVVRYSISLPDDYYTACTQYPVVYALHGRDQNNVGFLDDALSLRTAMNAGVLDQAIIVTPDSYSTGRWENRDTGPAEDNFILYLIPHVEQTYRVRPGASNRLLTGFSMGGHGAFRFGLKYPQMFAAVWSVDGAMAGSELYLPFVKGKRSTDFHIISVGGRLNGDRVKRLVDDLGSQGIEIPYVYQDLEHDFATFVDADEKAGWVAVKFLQSNLGRAG
jgi:hypothetical protein